MRLFAIIILLAVINVSALFSHNAADSVRKLAGVNEFARAAAFIPEAIKDNKKNLDFLLLCGDIYMELEKCQQAYDVYIKADDIDGGEPYIMRRVGTSLSCLGKHHEALEILHEAVDEDKDDPQNLLTLAKAYIRADSLGKAELNITRAREMDKSNPNAYIGLGDLYFAQGVYELARQNYEEALNLEEDLLEARAKLATSYYWLGMREYDHDLANELFARSLKEWTTVTKKDPKNAKAFFQVGKIYFYSKKYMDAAKALTEFSRLRPDGALGRWYLAQSLYEVGMCDSAARHLNYCSEMIDSVRIKAKLLLARCYFENKNYPLAVQMFGSIKADTTLGFLDMQRFGNSAWLSGDTVNAVEINTETINMYPAKSCKLMDRFGRLLIYLKKYDESIAIFRKRIATAECNDSTNESKNNYFIGIAFFQSERPDSALSYLAKAVELDSNDLNSRLYLGDVYAALGDKNKAISQFSIITKNGVLDTAKYSNVLLNAFNKLSQLYYEMKKYNKVIETGKLWAKATPGKYFPYLWTAYAYFGLSDTDKACANLRKVIKIDPKNANARKYLKENCGGK